MMALVFKSERGKPNKSFYYARCRRRYYSWLRFCCFRYWSGYILSSARAGEEYFEIHGLINRIWNVYAIKSKVKNILIKYNAQKRWISLSRNKSALISIIPEGWMGLDGMVGVGGSGLNTRHTKTLNGRTQSRSFSFIFENTHRCYWHFMHDILSLAACYWNPATFHLTPLNPPLGGPRWHTHVKSKRAADHKKLGGLQMTRVVNMN